MRRWTLLRLALAGAVAATAATAAAAAAATNGGGGGARDGAQFDPYAVLGVPRDASAAQIKRAYRKLAVAEHPDKAAAGGEKDAAARFAEVARAYEILSDDAARESFNIGAFATRWEYDAWKARNKGAAGGPTGKGFYPPDGPVVPWDRAAFARGVRARSKPILVMFYADWCVHCQHFAKHYRAIALALGDAAVVAAVNCGDDESLCHQEQVPGYPTLRLLTPLPDASVETFAGPLDAVEPVLQWVADTTSTALVKLTSVEDLQRTVLASPEPWLVAFSAGPWCPPCMAVKSTVRRAAARLAGRVRVGIVDCDEARHLCGQQAIGMFPTLRVYPAAKGGLPAHGAKDLFLEQQTVMHAPAVAALELAVTLMETVVPPAAAHSGSTPAAAAVGHDDL